MPPLALGLVLVAAFTHASWNLLAKQAAASRHFVWLYSAGTVVVWAPVIVAVMILLRPDLGPQVVVALVVSAVLHTLYAMSLQRAYQVADLSVVYPLARGTGPFLAFFGAIVFLGERPRPLASGGAMLVAAGVLLLAGGGKIFARGADRAGLFWGVLTGALIASYSVWDGRSVRVLGVSPLLMDYAGNLLRLGMLSPRAWADRRGVVEEAGRWWRPALGVAILGPLGYTLVLYAMQLAPVSHVAPARELSMMIGAWYGARVLDERDSGRRLGATAMIVLGVAALAFG